MQLALVALVLFAAPGKLPPRPPSPEVKAQLAEACDALSRGRFDRAATLAGGLPVEDPAVPVLVDLIKIRKSDPRAPWLDHLARAWRANGSPALADSKLLPTPGWLERERRKVDPTTLQGFAGRWAAAALSDHPSPQLFDDAKKELGSGAVATRFLAIDVLRARAPRGREAEGRSVIAQGLRSPEGRASLALHRWAAATSSRADQPLVEADLAAIEAAVKLPRYGSGLDEMYRAIRTTLATAPPGIARAIAFQLAARARADLAVLALIHGRAQTTFEHGPPAMRPRLSAALTSLSEKLLAEPSLADLMIAVGLLDLIAGQGGDATVRWRLEQEKDRFSRLWGAANDRQDALAIARWPLPAMFEQLYEESALGELAMLERLEGVKKRR